MRKSLRLDDKLMIISVTFLAVTIGLMGAMVWSPMTEYLELLFIPSFLTYLGTFTLFLYYNHKLTQEDHGGGMGVLNIENPYKVSLCMGIFLFLVGVIGNMIEHNIILMASLSGGFLVMVYSVVGWHDVITD